MEEPKNRMEIFAKKEEDKGKIIEKDYHKFSDFI